MCAARHYDIGELDDYTHYQPPLVTDVYVITYTYREGLYT